MNNILYIAIFLIILFIILVYNRLISLRNYVKEAFSTMDVYLKKRWDLVPNLLKIVESYTGHEKNTFEEISKIRARDYNELSDSDKIDTNKLLATSLNKIFAVVENYPELKANEHYSQLMSELSSVENDIANSRKYYNGCVRMLNNTVEIFPTNIISHIFGIKSEKMFEISDIERQNVEIN